jgi:hypothetical protein
MKKLLLSTAVIGYLGATTLNELFEGVKNAPQTKIDSLLTENVKETKKSIENSLFPKISVTGSIEHFNRDMALVAITPTESAKLSKSGQGIPFGNNIQRLGINLSMPLYVREIYKNQKKLSYLIKSKKYQNRVNLLSKEMVVINYVTTYNYLIKYKLALTIQQNSILKTIEAISEGVKNGAIPEFNLIRLKDSLNQLKINILNIDKQIAEVKGKLFALTGVIIDNVIQLKSGNYLRGDLIALKPIKEKINSDIEDIDAKKSVFYPKVYLKIQASKNRTKAYNNGDSVYENQASIGVYLEWKIFDKQNRDIQKAKITLTKDMLELKRVRKELEAEVLKLTETVQFLNTQIEEAKNSIKLKKQLLKSAKVAFEIGSMKVDDYLKYEDNLANTKATLAKLIAQKNSSIAQLAFIYGNDITKIFKEK